MPDASQPAGPTARAEAGKLAAGPPKRIPLRGIWPTVWLIASLVTLGVVLSSRNAGGPLAVKVSLAFLAQLLAVLALWRWLGALQISGLAAATATRRWRLTLAILVGVVALVSLGSRWQVAMAAAAVAAIAVLVGLRPSVSARELIYALVLGVLASAGGLVEWSVSRSRGDIAVAAVQLPVVLVTLLAAWAIADRVDWRPAGVGQASFLAGGVRTALRDLAWGFVLAAPWAFGNIAAGPFEEDHYRAGWQVLAALRPGIAEEAWARVFVVSVLYWGFRRHARARTAMIVAALLGSYWFAYLHTSINPVALLLFGTAQALPMTYLWLRRGLEAAIGFHFCVDLVRFLASYLAVSGIWFS